MQLPHESELPLRAAAQTIVLLEQPTGRLGGALGPPDQGREVVGRLHHRPPAVGLWSAIDNDVRRMERSATFPPSTYWDNIISAIAASGRPVSRQ